MLSAEATPGNDREAVRSAAISSRPHAPGFQTNAAYRFFKRTSAFSKGSYVCYCWHFHSASHSQFRSSSGQAILSFGTRLMYVKATACGQVEEPMTYDGHHASVYQEYDPPAARLG